jgi:hypothetical protein
MRAAERGVRQAAHHHFCFVCVTLSFSLCSSCCPSLSLSLSLFAESHPSPYCCHCALPPPKTIQPKKLSQSAVLMLSFRERKSCLASLVSILLIRIDRGELSRQSEHGESRFSGGDIFCAIFQAKTRLVFAATKCVFCPLT